MRFWRDTTVADAAAGQTATLGTGTLGYEWDEDLDNGARPPGLIRLSTTTANVSRYLQDYGSTYARGTATHRLTLYRASQRRPGLRGRHGAVVLGTGQQPRPRAGCDRGHAGAAGHSQPVRRHGRAAGARSRPG